MKHTNVFENRKIILDQLILLNNLEQEKYDLLKDQDFLEIKRNSLDYDEAVMKLYELFEVQNKLEIGDRAKTVFGQLGKFLNLKDDINMQTAEVLTSTILEILKVLHDKKLELAKVKDRTNYFLLQKIEEELTRQLK